MFEKGLLFFFLLMCCFVANTSLAQSSEQADTTFIDLMLAKSRKIVDSNPDSAMYYITQAIMIANQGQYDVWLGKCYNSVGAAYYIKGNYSEALNYYKQALEIFTKNGYAKGMCQANLNMGIIYSRAGFFVKATEVYVASLRIAEQNNLKALQASIYNSLGVLAKLQNQYKEAIAHYNNSLKISEELHDKKSIAGTYSNIANIYMVSQDYDNFIKYNFKSIHLFDSLKNTRGLVTSYNNLGEGYRRLQRYDDAKTYSIKALEIAQQSGFTGQYILALKGLAEIEVDLKNYGKALEYINEAKSKINEKDRSVLHEFLSLEATCYAKLNDFKNAYNSLELSKILRDSIFNREMTVTINQTKAAYELDKKESEIKVLKAENDAKQLQIVQLVALGILTLGLIIMIVSYFHLSLKKKKDLAEITALRTQMNPHFIFNSLNSINRFIIKSDPESASFYLTQFSKLIRLILENSKNEKITLEQELKALSLYMDMERLRFNNKFEYEIKVAPEVNVSTVEIPPLILQPYVENAIWHGIMKNNQEGKVVISIDENSDGLLLQVEDNGIGIHESQKNTDNTYGKKSLGLGITLQRLNFFAKKQNKKASVTVTDLKSNGNAYTGTAVKISIPKVKLQ